MLTSGRDKEHVTKQESADIIFHLEELLIEADFRRHKIGNCGGVCRGSSEEDYRKLCLACSKALKEEMEAIKRLAEKDEVSETMRKVKEAVENLPRRNSKGFWIWPDGQLCIEQQKSGA